MKQAYLDSSVWIVMTVGIPLYRTVVRNALQGLEEDGWLFCLSDLVVLEVKLKPYRQNRLDLLTEYDTLFSVAIHFPSFDSVFHDALVQAKTKGLKAMDATHIAFADKYLCDLFVTTDPDFRTLKSPTLYWIDLSQATLP